jgi:hypothetical protein
VAAGTQVIYDGALQPGLPGQRAEGLWPISAETERSMNSSSSRAPGTSRNRGWNDTMFESAAGRPT